MSNQRVPTMKDSLANLRYKGVAVGTVLDVGILTGTQPLIEVFGNLPHHLFEPVDLHFKQIKNNYRNIDFVLHHVALSDSDGTAFLACRAIHGDGRVTHADVVPNFVTEDDVPGLVSCIEIPKARLDSLLSTTESPKPFLLKIDVDGHEMNVLRGATETLSQTAVVVIEAPINRTNLPHFFERSQFLMDSGFYLMDIVDMAYYDGVLWQVDLIFVRKEVVDEIDTLRPFEAEGFSFSGSDWYPLSDRHFAKHSPG